MLKGTQFAAGNVNLQRFFLLHLHCGFLSIYANGPLLLNTWTKINATLISTYSSTSWEGSREEPQNYLCVLERTSVIV